MPLKWDFKASFKFRKDRSEIDDLLNIGDVKGLVAKIASNNHRESLADKTCAKILRNSELLRLTWKPNHKYLAAFIAVGEKKYKIQIHRKDAYAGQVEVKEFVAQGLELADINDREIEQFAKALDLEIQSKSNTENQSGGQLPPAPTASIVTENPNPSGFQGDVGQSENGVQDGDVHHHLPMQSDLEQSRKLLRKRTAKNLLETSGMLPPLIAAVVELKKSFRYLTAEKQSEPNHKPFKEVRGIILSQIITLRKNDAAGEKRDLASKLYKSFHQNIIEAIPSQWVENIFSSIDEAVVLEGKDGSEDKARLMIREGCLESKLLKSINDLNEAPTDSKASEAKTRASTLLLQKLDLSIKREQSEVLRSLYLSQKKILLCEVATNIRNSQNIKDDACVRILKLEQEVTGDDARDFLNYSEIKSRVREFTSETLRSDKEEEIQKMNSFLKANPRSTWDPTLHRLIVAMSEKGMDLGVGLLNQNEFPKSSESANNGIGNANALSRSDTTTSQNMGKTLSRSQTGFGQLGGPSSSNEAIYTYDETKAWFVLNQNKVSELKRGSGFADIIPRNSELYYQDNPKEFVLSLLLRNSASLKSEDGAARSWDKDNEWRNASVSRVMKFQLDGVKYKVDIATQSTSYNPLGRIKFEKITKLALKEEFASQNLDDPTFVQSLLKHLKHYRNTLSALKEKEYKTSYADRPEVQETCQPLRQEILESRLQALNLDLETADVVLSYLPSNNSLLSAGDTRQKKVSPPRYAVNTAVVGALPKASHNKSWSDNLISAPSYHDQSRGSNYGDNGKGLPIPRAESFYYPPDNATLDQPLAFQYLDFVEKIGKRNFYYEEIPLGMLYTTSVAAVREDEENNQVPFCNVVDSAGMTFLGYAATRGGQDGLDTIKYLIETVGIDINSTAKRVTNSRGSLITKTALDLAIENGNEDVQKYLKSNGAQLSKNSNKVAGSSQTPEGQKRRVDLSNQSAQEREIADTTVKEVEEWLLKKEMDAAVENKNFDKVKELIERLIKENNKVNIGVVIEILSSEIDLKNEEYLEKYRTFLEEIAEILKMKGSSLEKEIFSAVTNINKLPGSVEKNRKLDNLVFIMEVVTGSVNHDLSFVSSSRTPPQTPNDFNPGSRRVGIFEGISTIASRTPAKQVNQYGSQSNLQDRFVGNNTTPMAEGDSVPNEARQSREGRFSSIENDFSDSDDDLGEIIKVRTGNTTSSRKRAAASALNISPTPYDQRDRGSDSKAEDDLVTEPNGGANTEPKLFKSPKKHPNTSFTVATPVTPPLSPSQVSTEESVKASLTSVRAKQSINVSPIMESEELPQEWRSETTLVKLSLYTDEYLKEDFMVLEIGEKKARINKGKNFDLLKKLYDEQVRSSSRAEVDTIEVQVPNDLISQLSMDGETTLVKLALCYETLSKEDYFLIDIGREVIRINKGVELFNSLKELYDEYVRSSSREEVVTIGIQVSNDLIPQFRGFVGSYSESSAAASVVPKPSAPFLSPVHAQGQGSSPQMLTGGSNIQSESFEVMDESIKRLIANIRYNSSLNVSGQSPSSRIDQLVLPSSLYSRSVLFPPSDMDTSEFSKESSSVMRLWPDKVREEWIKGEKVVPVEINESDVATKELPSTSAKETDAVKLVETTLYKPISISEDSIWHANNSTSTRGNDLKVVKGVYGKDGTSEKEEIEKTMIDIIYKVAADQGLTLGDVSNIIKDARVKGGINNKWEENQKKYSLRDGQECAEDNFRIAKKFSKKFQDECKACGILSGRGESNVGLRTSFIPLTVTNKIEENLSFDVVELTPESEQNLKDRKEARDQAVSKSPERTRR